MSTTFSDASRFWEKVNLLAPNWCWEWIPEPGSNSYGKFWWNGQSVSAHRWAYEFVVGPIAEGLTIDHLCSNRICVNPSHLEPVPFQVNNDRKLAGRVTCKRGHEYSGSVCVPCRTISQKAYRERQKAKVSQ